MKRKGLIGVASMFIALVVCLMGTGMVLADDPDIWIKTDGVNEITPALTEGTLTPLDDEASEFVHKIQWEGLSFTSAAGALGWVHEAISYEYDDVNYEVPEAWANPEKTLTTESGDCEDQAFLLASLLKFHTTEVKIDKGDKVYVKCGVVFLGLHAWVFWWDASEYTWYQLDPVNGEMYEVFYPGVGTLWLNDGVVHGFAPGYYPIG